MISEVIVRVGQRMMEVEGSERMERGAIRDRCKKVPLPFERAICQSFIMFIRGPIETKTVSNCSFRGQDFCYLEY